MRETRGGTILQLTVYVDLLEQIQQVRPERLWVVTPGEGGGFAATAYRTADYDAYAPSETAYWQHGRSTERDFIYVTTQQLSHDQLAQLSDEVGPERSLLVMCTAFRGKADAYPNLTIKRIPKTVLSRCEWGRDDYSLEVANLAAAPPKAGQQGLGFED